MGKPVCGKFFRKDIRLQLFYSGMWGVIGQPNRSCEFMNNIIMGTDLLLNIPSNSYSLFHYLETQLVHRHTHRVVRGSLLLCGRPDGRLSALTSMETSVCLSINQASSIQSIGGTCESVTIVSGELLSLSRFFVHRNVHNYRNLHYFNILYLGSQSVSTSFKQESNLFG